MKKFVLNSIFVLSGVVFFTSCKKDAADITINGSNNYSNLGGRLDYALQASYFERMSYEAFNNSAANLGNYITKTSDSTFVFNSKLYGTASLSFLQENYFHTDTDFSTLYLDEASVSIPQDIPSISRINLADYSHFSSAQIEITQRFIDEVLLVETFDSVIILSRKFQGTVFNSSLEEDEKTELIALTASLISLSRFMIEGGDNVIYQNVFNNSSAGGRIMGCSVSTRSVLASATTGLLIGGIDGAIIGCTGGTVAFPGLGTATGCVGGAVIGGATGFIKGAIGGILVDLTLTCGRG